MDTIPSENTNMQNPTCYHCGRPPIQRYGTDDGGTLLLCLDCALKFETIEREKQQRIVAQFNYVQELSGMLTGIQFPRFPVQPPPVYLPAGNTLNHIHVTDSNIGVLNTGHIQTVDSAVGFLSNAGTPEVACAIKTLTEAIVDSTEATKDQKNELLELLSLISTEATVSAKNRKSKGIKPILIQIASLLSGLNALSSLWTKYSPVITNFFGLA
jgi:hypothetical protein